MHEKKFIINLPKKFIEQNKFYFSLNPYMNHTIIFIIIQCIQQ